MHHWWPKNLQAALEDFAHQAQSPLDLQGGHQKIADKEDQWTNALTKNLNELKGNIKSRQLKAIQITCPHQRQINMPVLPGLHVYRFLIHSLQKLLAVAANRTTYLWKATPTASFTIVTTAWPQYAAISNTTAALWRPATRVMKPDL